MTEHDYELLSQYIDGELDPPATAALVSRLAEETTLRVALEQMRSADHRVRRMAEVPGADAVPAGIAALLEQRPGNVIPFPNRRGWAGTGLAVAASLVAAVGLVLAPQWRPGEESPISNAEREALVAQALEITPSSAERWTILADGSHLRAVLSFAGNEGQWCREYQLRTDSESWHGVACRDRGVWQTEVRAAGQAHTTDNVSYLPAGAGDVDVVSSFISDNASTIPLSAREEADLIANDWQ